MSLTKDEIAKLLSTEEVAYIATARKDGAPHLVPIWFVYHEGKIYVYTKKTSVKFKNLIKINKLSLCFGGKETYIVEGFVKLYSFDDAPVDMRNLLWKKYPRGMQERYTSPENIVMEVVPTKELSWHYEE